MEYVFLLPTRCGHFVTQKFVSLVKCRELLIAANNIQVPKLLSFKTSCYHIYLYRVLKLQVLYKSNKTYSATEVVISTREK